MLRFFRNIRHVLLEKGKIRRYTVYALGEIFLLVVGVLIALQVNNWNEKRKYNAEFKGLMEQVYNALQVDNDMLLTSIDFSGKQIDMARRLLNQPDSISEWILPYALFWIDYDLLPTDNAGIYSSYLSANSANLKYQEIIKSILLYIEGQSLITAYYDQYFKEGELTGFLKQHNIPMANQNFMLIYSGNFSNISNGTYTTEEIGHLKNLLGTERCRSIIKSIIAEKSQMITGYYYSIENMNALLKQIEKAFPDAHLLYENIEIIGDALPSGWNQPVPMKRKDKNRSIWEIEIETKGGEVKFRANDSWNQNWGGNDFPAGKAIFLGQNIYVPPGKYSVTFDLENRDYNFVEIER